MTYAPIMESVPPDGDAELSAAAVVARLGDRLDSISASMCEQLLDAITEYREQTALLSLFRDSVQQNVEAVFSAIGNNVPADQLRAPPAAVAHAQELARRASPSITLMRAYRLGHQSLMEIVLEDVRALHLPAEQGLDVLRMISAVTFKYIDQITDQVSAAYQVVREQCLAAASTARALRVRELLEPTPVDVDLMSAEIGYPLRRTHLAVVFSYPDLPRGEELTHIERFARSLGEAVDGVGSPLLIADDRLTGWGWIALSCNDSDLLMTRARAFIASHDSPPLVAFGDPLTGVEGFRRSHRQALGARSVCLAGGSRQQVIASSDPGVAVAALHAGDLLAAREWVGGVLGPLASATEADERLRDTLRVFLLAGSSYKAAASELTMHFNTVRYRVQRAEERLGRPLSGSDRLDVEVALLLCHWLRGGVVG